MLPDLELPSSVLPVRMHSNHSGQGPHSFLTLGAYSLQIATVRKLARHPATVFGLWTAPNDRALIHRWLPVVQGLRSFTTKGKVIKGCRGCSGTAEIGSGHLYMTLLPSEGQELCQSSIPVSIALGPVRTPVDAQYAELTLPVAGQPPCEGSTISANCSAIALCRAACIEYPFH